MTMKMAVGMAACGLLEREFLFTPAGFEDDFRVGAIFGVYPMNLTC